jgi:hypothetical protein
MIKKDECYEYKANNGVTVWIKIIRELSEDYEVEREIIKDEDEKESKNDIIKLNKKFLNDKEKTGELKKLSKDNKFLFELG